MYCSLSSITIPEPLSAFLMTRVWSLARSFKAFCCDMVRFFLNGLGASCSISVLILVRYDSMLLDALGGCQVLFFLKGCGSWEVEFLKKYFSLLFLEKLRCDCTSFDASICLFGTNVRPRESTCFSVCVRCLEDKLVMYLFPSNLLFALLLIENLILL